MPSGPLRFETTRHGRQSVTMRLAGDLDFDTAPAFVRAANRLLADGHCHLTVDLAGVDMCDSSGLSALIEVRRCAVASGGSMSPVNAGPALVRLFERTGLDRVFALPAAGSAVG
ncbi:STAS domain-containing protein [Plantactinospora sp. GCM10030261]|uniref:STAS domain-containing protein n=1 Tax=Plantactinospora sp. GCM10030261 TaxID=3273420 RepID=UPI0036117057